MNQDTAARLQEINNLLGKAEMLVQELREDLDVLERNSLDNELDTILVFLSQAHMMSQFISMPGVERAQDFFGGDKVDIRTLENNTNDFFGHADIALIGDTELEDELDG